MLTKILLRDSLRRADEPGLALLVEEELGAATVTVVRVEIDQRGIDHLTPIRCIDVGSEDDAEETTAAVSVDLADLHDTLVLLRQSATRLDTRARVERKLQRRRRAGEHEERLRRTATRATKRVDELVLELDAAEAEIAELQATLAARGVEPPPLAAEPPAGTQEPEDVPDAP